MVVAMMLVSGGLIVINEAISGAEVGNSVLSDTTPPQVVSVSPTDGATASLSTNIVVEFSEPMNQSATQSAFSITPDVNGSFSWNAAGDTMTFTPDSNLSNNTIYRPTIDSSLAKDLAGNLLDGNGDTWETRADMPTARAAPTASAVSDKIYVIGGNNQFPPPPPGSLLSVVEIYDTLTDTWTTGSSMPTARSGLASAVVNGEIYAIGGWDNSASKTYDIVEEYNPLNDTWTTKSPMSSARRGLVAVALNNRIYAIGGYNGGALSLVEEYNPANNTWTTKSPLPTATAYGCGAVVNGRIYVTGGSGGRITQEYNPETDTWRTDAYMPTDRMDLAAASLKGKLYAIGGSDRDGNALSTNEEFDALGNPWTTKSDMPTSRYDLVAAEVNGKIYVMGGSNSSDFLSTNEVYIPNDDYSWYFTAKSIPTFDIPIHAGWNLISYPLLSSGDIETVLNDNNVVWDHAQWYNPQDAGDHWKTHTVGRTLNDLNTIDNTMGIWLHVTDVGDGNLTVTGIAPTTTSVTLHAGWNLVSYPSSSSPLMSNASLPVEVTRTAEYDPDAPYLVSEVTDWTTNSFVPGQGYWIYATADTIWNVNY